ncbi:DUF488 family protein [Coraliomargarita sp. SDUM461003]|uniref:DUF488 family protein n=1 Tax=Thalassobacterium maritimum TaxID=3041265 RepID=A0ABU1ARW5_9BACT|nr:DUF488 family protein [Coraliomargarita sp. SDUM461003]MDQ8206908.1 DUF488 family protein [Coraliomargarita sp. SDUM461003]
MTTATKLKAPTYMRQRLLLFFLDAAGDALSKMDLQKLLFLYHEDTEAAHYAFVPYRFGSYSFLAADDLDLMEKRGWVESEGKELTLGASIEKESWARNNAERRAVKRWMYRNTHRGDRLVAETYRRFPYYAINSEMRERLLSSAEMAAVKSALPHPEETTDPLVFTIGYEGIHFEEYINKLIRHQVAVLCDVRRNPLSRKFGFSSKMLARVLPSLGIEYIHLPELGIESDKRKELNSMADYESLFAGYRVELPNRTKGLDRLKSIIDQHKRVALTCFEAEPHCCHRHCISDLLEAQAGYKVTHL